MDPSNVEKKAQKFLNWGQRNQESLGRLFATFFIKVLYRFTFKPKHRLQNKLQYMLLYNELAFLSCSYNL